jgi:hypothetical protein
LTCHRDRLASVRPDVTTPTASRTPDEAGRVGHPGWIYALAGWLLAVPQLDRDSRGPSEAEIRRRLPYGALGELDGDLDTRTVRGLRRLPAIGPARALAIARARWEEGLAGGPESWDAIRGIGPDTVAAIRRHLSEANGEGSTGPPARGAALPRLNGAEPAAESRPRF